MSRYSVWDICKPKYKFIYNLNYVHMHATFSNEALLVIYTSGMNYEEEYLGSYSDRDVVDDSVPGVAALVLQQQVILHL